MVLAGAAVQSVGSGDWTGLGVLLGIVALLMKFRGAPRPEPASDEQIEQWADEAGIALTRRWAPGLPPVSMADHFAAQLYASHQEDLTRVVTAFERCAIRYPQEDGTVLYIPSSDLINRSVHDGLRQIVEKDFGHRINVGNGSVANIGDNNVMTGVSTSAQTITITEQQSAVLEELIRDFYRFSLHVTGMDKQIVQDLQRDLEDAARTRDGHALPGIARRIKELVARLPTTQPYVTTVSAAVNLLQQLIGFHW